MINTPTLQTIVLDDYEIHVADLEDLFDKGIGITQRVVRTVSLNESDITQQANVVVILDLLFGELAKNMIYLKIMAMIAQVHHPLRSKSRSKNLHAYFKADEQVAKSFGSNLVIEALTVTRDTLLKIHHPWWAYLLRKSIYAQFEERIKRLKEPD